MLLRVEDREGRELIAWARKTPSRESVPPPATEPPLPADIASADELYVTGLHLEQCPAMPPALRSRIGAKPCGAIRAMRAATMRWGLWHLRRGNLPWRRHISRRAIERLTLRNANPRDGEPHYNLGLTLRFLGRDEEAYAAFYKSAWNQAWQGAAYHALAEFDCRRADWTTALNHLDRSLRLNTDNLGARNLRALVLRKMGREADAEAQLRATLALDPLDWWAWHLADKPLRCATQVRLDIALDFARAGFYSEALAVLEAGNPDPGTAPLLEYYKGWLHAQLGNASKAASCFRAAAKATPDYCFPSRLEEIIILEAAILAHPKDARAPYYLGNLFYDRKRHGEAIQLWENRRSSTPAILWSGATSASATSI